VVLLLSASPSVAVDPLPIVDHVEAQPFVAQAARVVQTLELLGSPLSKATRDALQSATKIEDAAERVRKIQESLDPLCLAGVNINAESRVKGSRGPAAANLLQHGWRVFLVKVHNEAGVTAPLRVTSVNALPMHKKSKASPRPEPSISSADVENRWMDVHSYESPPLIKALSGLLVEYRVLEIYSRDAGKREANLAFDVGQGTQDLAFRNELNILFDAAPAIPVKLDIVDDDGKPAMASLVIRDEHGHVYPARSRRLAPDFFFHDQIYRASGEPVLLPPGEFTVIYTRGPEYVEQERKIDVSANGETKIEPLRLKRWIRMTDHGWYSGDHHIHAAGCAHYESPAEGVKPEDMMRHVLGEDLNVGCVLSWGPCWYHQKQFFEGRVSTLSKPTNLMRYDIEVSGFPSSHAGHLCMLRLKEDDYPGTKAIEDWPSWDLPVLKWGKEQGGIVGFAHSGWGLQTESTELPNYEMPKFDGIGANEFIVDTVHGACDFISAVDTPAPWELNIWYHTLNCGMTTRISGETDFPCIYGERVGIGRSYVKLESGKKLDYDAWVDGIRDGRSYVGDGRSHLFDLQVGSLALGQEGAGGRPSVLAAERDRPLKVTLKAAAMLAEQPLEEFVKLGRDVTQKGQKPYWHIERARIGDTRKVPVELIVNGESVEKRVIEADGSITDITFDYTPRKSSWIAVRIYPSSHTNPIFVEVDAKPIRASKRSAQWCLEAVDVCWSSKKGLIRESEREAAAAAYEVARQAYRRVMAECRD
jgi:hypothetical protein